MRLVLPIPRGCRRLHNFGVLHVDRMVSAPWITMRTSVLQNKICSSFLVEKKALQADWQATIPDDEQSILNGVSSLATRPTSQVVVAMNRSKNIIVGHWILNCVKMAGEFSHASASRETLAPLIKASATA